MISPAGNASALSTDPNERAYPLGGSMDSLVDLLAEGFVPSCRPGGALARDKPGFDVQHSTWWTRPEGSIFDR